MASNQVGGILFHPSTPSSKTVDYQANLCSHCAEATNASRAESDQRRAETYVAVGQFRARRKEECEWPQMGIFSSSVGCLSLKIGKKVREDFASYTSDLAVEAQRAVTRFDQSTLFNIVKHLKFKSSPTVPCVLLEGGKPASSHQEEQSRWLRHHAKQFGGSVLTEAPYAQSCKIERAAEQVMTAGNMSSVEILDQVAEVIAELPNRKAQGEGSVPNEILKAGGQPVCLQLVQLCSKANGPVVFQGK